MPRPPRRLRAWVELAEAEGWTYDETNDGHPRLTPPAGMLWPGRGDRLAAPVTFASTPSDSQAGDRNAVTLLRRLGVPIPHKGHTKGKGDR